MNVFTFPRHEDLPEGPWKQEPDKVVWVDEATDLDCMMLRNYYGVWCGYVGVPSSHPLHGIEYNDVRDLAVHGGLTFSDSGHNGSGIDNVPEDQICHTPLPGRDPNVWWFGFDCNHHNDYSPIMAKNFPDLRLITDGVYRDQNYVQGVVEDLARQLKEIA